MEQKIADKLFTAYTNYVYIESQVMDELLECFGINPMEPDDWPFEDYSHDDYDHSFELLDVDPEWEPTKVGLEKCWELGFDRCWVNYTDETEKYYYKNDE